MKDASSLKIAVLVSRFNERVTGALLKGCLERLKALGVREECVGTAWVPGAFELPFAAMQTARLGSDSRPDAIVCLGAVIRGGTPHFDYVCAECARGIMRVGLSTGVPAIFGVLTCDTLEQALERCGETDAVRFMERRRHIVKQPYRSRSYSRYGSADLAQYLVSVLYYIEYCHRSSYI